MRETTEIILMNLSKMAGGPGDIEHGKKIIFEMHNTDWMNAKARMRELAFQEKQFDFMTKPLLKGITMRPFLNEPTDLSVGEFGALMDGVSTLARMQGGMEGMGVMGEAAEDAWKRLQTIRDDTTKKHTAEGQTDWKKVDAELLRLYNDPNSDYRHAADMTSQYFYAWNPVFDANNEPIPWKDLPREMQNIPKYVEEGFAQNFRNRWNQRFYKWFGRGDELTGPPSLGPGVGEQPQEQAGPTDYSSGQSYLGN